MWSVACTPSEATVSSFDIHPAEVAASRNSETGWVNPMPRGSTFGLRVKTRAVFVPCPEVLRLDALNLCDTFKVGVSSNNCHMI